MTSPEPHPDLPLDPPASAPTVDEARRVKHTRSRATYFGWIVGIIVTILLLVFILQNQDSQEIDLIFGTVNLPVGVSLLIAALLGAIITVAISAARMVELHRALKKVDRAQKKR
ncbi:lipopolysaccharide assembly LapA domain-containing protein [Gordonia phosphorivorans]|uniref:Lipopolysaccharide assembly LapA domain-containing protein n=1 Tax=Gordonia phosphorivorans TaxID=1056982 RepID=A0ABV6H9A2_9ACTN